MIIQDSVSLVVDGSTSSYTLLPLNNVSVQVEMALPHRFERVVSATLFISVSSAVNSILEDDISVLSSSYISIDNLLDYFQIEVRNSITYIKFDVTKIYSNSCPSSFVFTLRNASNIQFDIYPNNSFVELTKASPFECLLNQSLISSNVGKSIQYEQDIVSFNHYLSIPLFETIYSFDLSLVYDAFNPTSTDFFFFPKGWKINLFEKLIQNSDTFTLIDKKYNRRVFKKSLNNNDIYIDSTGSSLLLETIIVHTGNTSEQFYKIYSPIVSSYKLYNLSGYLVRIVKENNDLINISYSSNTITVTDGFGNTISFTKVARNITITSNTSTQTYLLTISSNRLMNVRFKDNKNSSTYLTDSFTYSNDYLVSISGYDDYSLLINVLENSLTSTIKYNSIVINQYLLTRYLNKAVLLNLLKDISNIYYFNDEGKILYSNEDTGLINDNDVIFYQSEYIDFNRIKISSGTPFSFNNNPNCHQASLSLSYVGNSSNIFTDYVSNVSPGYYAVVVMVNQNRYVPSKQNKKRNMFVSIDGNQASLTNHIMFFDNDNTEIKSYIFYKSTSDSIKLNFSISNNLGTFTILSALLIKLDDTYTSLLYENSNSTNPKVTLVLPDETTIKYDGVFDICVANTPNFLSNDDVLINQLSSFKNTSRSYFYVNNLKDIYINDTSILINLNNQGNSVVFSSFNFAFFSETSTERIVNRLEQHSNSSYKSDIYRIKNSSQQHKYSIIDYHGNVLESNDYQGVKTTNAFDSSLNNISSIISSNDDLLQIIKTSSYDSQNRLISNSNKIGNYDGVITSFSYSSTLNVLSNKSDGNEITSYFLYSANYEYVNSISKSNHQILIDCSAKMNLESVSDGNSAHTFYYRYDNKNRLLNVYYVESLVEHNLLSANYLEDIDHNETITYQYSNNSSLSSIYDKYNHLLSKNNDTDFQSTFTYHSPNPSISSIYSDARLTSISETQTGFTSQTTISYDSDNDISQIVESNLFGTITFAYTYDTFHLLSTNNESIAGTSIDIVDSINKKTTYLYDPLDDSISSINTKLQIYLLQSPITIIEVNNSVTKDSLNRILSSQIYLMYSAFSLITYSYSYYTSSDNISTCHQIKKVTYEDNNYEQYSYDCNGNITNILFNNGNMITYQYDDNNQLVKETFLLGTIRHIVYSYDNYGNILSVTYKNSLNQTISSKSFEYSNIHPNVLAKYNNVNVSCDSLFNITSLSGATLTYNRVNMLSTYASNNTNASYLYNYEGIRIKKVVNDVVHQYVLDGHNISREIISQTVSPYEKHQIIYLYGLNGVIGFYYDSGLYLYRKDLFNNITEIYQVNNNTKTLVAKYRYLDAYGNHEVLNPDNTVNTSSTFIGNINPFRYRSYYYDNESGYYYCNHRYYVPFIYRWLTMDDLSYLDSSKINGINLFCYCNNNPVMNVDPEGNFLIELLILAALSGLATATAEQIIEINLKNQKWNGERFKRMFLDVFVTNSSISFGIVRFLITGDILSGILLTASINQSVDVIYYYCFSNTNNDINTCSYLNMHLTRWDRMDYLKKTYPNINYFRIMYLNGEFLLHQIGYDFIYLLNEKDKKSILNGADLDEENRLIVLVLSYIFGFLGI